MGKAVQKHEVELLRHHEVSQSTLSLFHERRKGYDLTFGSCLAKFCGNECADVRDKVYGLIGVAQDEPAFSVDCSKSAQDVYLDVAKDSRNDYLKRRLKPAPALEVYPSKPVEFYRVLVELAVQMGFLNAEVGSLEFTMTEIWTPDVTEEYDGNGCPAYPPITAMGTRRGHGWKETTMTHHQTVKARCCQIAGGTSARDRGAIMAIHDRVRRP
jgi:hypothetical protein